MVDYGWINWGIAFMLAAAVGVALSHATEEWASSEWVGHNASVVALALSPDHRTLASIDASGVAIVWDTATAQRVDLYDVRSAAATMIAVADTGAIAVALADGPAVVAQPGGEPIALSMGSRVAEVVGISPDGKRIATANAQGVGVLWTPDGNPNATLVMDTAFQPGAAPTVADVSSTERISFAETLDIVVFATRVDSQIFDSTKGTTVPASKFSLLGGMAPVAVSDTVVAGQRRTYFVDRSIMINTMHDELFKSDQIAWRTAQFADDTDNNGDPIPLTNPVVRWAAATPKFSAVYLGQPDGTISVMRPSDRVSDAVIATMLALMAVMAVALMWTANRHHQTLEVSPSERAAAREHWKAVAPDLARQQTKLLGLAMIAIGLGSLAAKHASIPQLTALTWIPAAIGLHVYRRSEQMGRQWAIWLLWAGLATGAGCAGRLLAGDRPMELTLAGYEQLLPIWAEWIAAFLLVAVCTWGRWVLTHPAIACHFHDPDPKKPPNDATA